MAKLRESLQFTRRRDFQLENQLVMGSVEMTSPGAMDLSSHRSVRLKISTVLPMCFNSGGRRHTSLSNRVLLIRRGGMKSSSFFTSFFGACSALAGSLLTTLPVVLGACVVVCTPTVGMSGVGFGVLITSLFGSGISEAVGCTSPSFSVFDASSRDSVGEGEVVLCATSTLANASTPLHSTRR